MATITVQHFICFASDCRRQQLMAQANAENRFHTSRFNDISNIGNRFLTNDRIARAIAQKQTIIFGIVYFMIPWNDINTSATL